MRVPLSLWMRSESGADALDVIKTVKVAQRGCDWP